MLPNLSQYNEPNEKFNQLPQTWQGLLSQGNPAIQTRGGSFQAPTQSAAYQHLYGKPVARLPGQNDKYLPHEIPGMPGQYYIPHQDQPWQLPLTPDRPHQFIAQRYHADPLRQVAELLKYRETGEVPTGEVKPFTPISANTSTAQSATPVASLQEQGAKIGTIPAGQPVPVSRPTSSPPQPVGFRPTPEWLSGVTGIDELQQALAILQGGTNGA
jgi:hypothetical protein